MTESLPELESLISHRLLGRPLRPADIAGEFLLIRTAWEAAGKPIPTAADFAFVARGSGSHLLKLISPRASSGQSVLRFLRKGANRQPDLAPSIDAKKAPVGKLVFRLLEIEGHPPRHLVDHILNPETCSALVLDGFAGAFGKDALTALREGLAAPLAVTRLPAAEFPIIFLPRPGGGDLQATPVAPVEAYVRMEEVTAPYFLKREEGRSDPPRGRWHRQEVSAKPQNISAAIGKRRTRFMARMPRVLDRWEAALHRYVRGGGFPRWQDESVAPAVRDYVALIDRARDYSNQDIRRGLDHRADSLIRAARAFVAEIIEEAHTHHSNAKFPPSPTIATLILNREWPNPNARDAARRVLTGPHFKDRLAIAEKR